MPQQNHDLVGQTLGQGQYEIRAVIGKGGMATVYRGYQRSVGREVAIKVLAPELAADDRLLARFEREARIVAQLQHPNILTVHDFGRENGILYLVLQLMTGGTLMDVLRRRGRLPVRRTLTLVYQIAAALDYAHGRGIVHRDLKPSNVLLDTDGNVCLTDFGIAKMIQGSTATGLTAANAMMGTPIYMAPEQWRSEPVTPQTDIYALGVMAYWMVVGQVPFSAETPHGLMYQHLHEAPEPPRSLNPDVPRAVEPVLSRALAKRPEARFESAGAFAAALDAAYNAATASPDAPPEHTRQHTTQRRTAPPPYNGPPRSAPRRYTPGHGSPPPESRLRDRARSTSAPLTSTGYVAPPRSAYGDRRQDDYLTETDPGIGRFFWVLGVVSLVVVIAFVLVLVASLITTGDNGATNGDPSGGGDVPAATTAAPESARPEATILQPPDQTLVSLGEPVRVEYVASGEEGVTEVQLRRFGQVLDSMAINNATRYQGSFIYTPDSTGPHTLEVLPLNGDITGEAARVIIFVQ